MTTSTPKTKKKTIKSATVPARFYHFDLPEPCHVYLFWHVERGKTYIEAFTIDPDGEAGREWFCEGERPSRKLARGVAERAIQRCTGDQLHEAWLDLAYEMNRGHDLAAKLRQAEDKLRSRAPSAGALALGG